MKAQKSLLSGKGKRGRTGKGREKAITGIKATRNRPISIGSVYLTVGSEGEKSIRRGVGN